MRWLTVVCLMALVSACAQAPAPRVAAPPPPPTLLDPDAACLQDLTSLQVMFEPVQAFGDPEQGCGIVNPVRVAGAGVAFNRPGVMTCDMARTVARFEREVIQPVAWAKFGQPVTKIVHAGTYDCRVRRNGTTQAAAGSSKSRGGRLSEHAKGRAIDLMGFELADGTRVSVKKDWRGAGAKSAFLQGVARGSCSTFNVVLTPNHDRLHQDHLHLDTGPYTLCGY
jgi:hypothetical protein